MRRLIVCADGTWNTPDRQQSGVFAPSNVVKAARAILPQAPDGTQQIVYYDRGVGTDSLADRLTGGAFGVGLANNVRDAYLFLVHNFLVGDEIYFLGFSRGAYTVRSTAGMIRKVGILNKDFADKDLEAWQLYRVRQGGADSPKAIDFRTRYSCHPVPIKFIGVWDTVGALGIPGFLSFLGRKRFEFHDVALSRSVDFAYQALAINEKRHFFTPALWEQNPKAEGQTLEQRWFPGVHMDVGGGYRDPSLADGALTWMIEKAQWTGLAFDEDYLRRIVHFDPLGTLHESRRLFYRLLPAHDRPIGEGIPKGLAVFEGTANEEVHENAVLRYGKDPTYRPRNLVDYLSKFKLVMTPGPKEDLPTQ